MTARVVALATHKGGTGKTTQSVHLACGMALRRGWRVLIVDTDPQGQAAVMLDEPKADGLYRLLVEGADPDDVLRAIPHARYAPPGTPAYRAGDVLLLPGDRRTQDIERERPDLMLFAASLRFLIRSHALDLIVIDTPPSANPFDAAVYHAADGIVYVTEMTPLALDGLREALRDFHGYNAQRAAWGLPDCALLGILPNRMDMRAGIQRRQLAALEASDYAPRLWYPIRERPAVWQTAAAEGLTVFARAPGSMADKEAREAVDFLAAALEGLEAT